MSRRAGTPRDLIERYQRHYNCTWSEAKIKAERGDPLTERGAGLRTGRAAIMTSERTNLISNVLGVLGAIFGSISLLIRLFEKEEE